MKVKSPLETKGKRIVSIGSDSSVEDAIKLMHANKISALIVTGDDKTAGIFTERDVVKCYVSTNGKSFKEIMVRDAMTLNLIVAEMEDDVSDIMSIMVEKNIRHLPVVDMGRIMGMLSVRDVVMTQVVTLTSEIHYLKDYISGS